MNPVYLIQLSSNQISVPVGQIPAMVAKAMHPEKWEFWLGREVLFDQLVKRVWHRVSMDFAGEFEAANQVRSILNRADEPELVGILTHLSGHNFYQLFIAGGHLRRIFQAVAANKIKLINRTPYGAKSIELDDYGMMAFSDGDRVSVPELARYMRPFGVVVDEAGGSGVSGIASPSLDTKPPQGVDEKRGKVLLRQLQIMGYDPECLPHNESGKAGVKAQVRTRIWDLQLTEFETPSEGFNPKSFRKAFDRAWIWLSNSKRIRYG